MSANIDTSTIPVGLPAAADLSAKLFRFGKFTSSGINVCSVAGERAGGVIGAHYKRTPAAGDAVDLYIDRLPIVEAGAAYAANAALTTDAQGRAVTAGAGDVVNAYAVDAAGAAGEYRRIRFPSSAAPIASNVADNNVAPGTPVVHVFSIADAASADYDLVITDKIEVIDVVAMKTSTAGGAANTVTIKNASTAITGALSLNIADTTLARATTIDDAASTIDAGGTLRASIAKAGGNAACKVFVYGIKRA
jgi:hypothetical protein